MPEPTLCTPLLRTRPRSLGRRALLLPCDHNCSAHAMLADAGALDLEAPAVVASLPSASRRFLASRPTPQCVSARSAISRRPLNLTANRPTRAPLP